MPSTRIGLDQRVQPGDQPGLRAGAAGRVNEPVDPQRHVVGLLHQLERHRGVAHGADRVRAAAGDRDTAWRPASRALRRPPRWRPACRCRRAGAASSIAHDAVQQHVAAAEIGRVVGLDPLLEHRRAAQAELHRHRRGLPHVVGLHRPLRHQVVGALGQRIAGQEFELAHLVAAEPHPGQVVPLHPNLGAAQRLGQVGQQLERRRRLAELHARELGKVHLRSP